MIAVTAVVSRRPARMIGRRGRCAGPPIVHRAGRGTDALVITRKTASVHVSNIMGKLGAANRGEAAALAHRLGIGDDVLLPGERG